MTAPYLRVDNCTIVSGQQLSDIIDIYSCIVVGILVPASLTSTAIAVQGAVTQDALATVPIVAVDGTPMSLVTTTASKLYYIPPSFSACAQKLQLNAGSAEGADRVFKILSRVIV